MDTASIGYYRHEFNERVMKIAYVLDRPELCGGVKVVFQHAALLRASGHDVSVLARGRRPRWSGWQGAYVDLDRKPATVPAQDLLIATFWSTVPVAARLDRGPVAQFCQGYEGSYPHLAAQREAIEQVYSRPLPSFVVSPHLGAMLTERFGREWRISSPPIDPVFQPAAREAPQRRPGIALHGIFECDWKGVETGLEAFRKMQEAGLRCRLERFSLLRRSKSEKAMVKTGRFHCRVSPSRAARIMRTCDLLLFPSLEAEGFGLPLLEAMASGVPVVASDIAATRFVTNGAMPLMPTGDARAFAERALELLGDRTRWLEARNTGLALAERFRHAGIRAQLEEAVHWAVEWHRRRRGA